MTNRGRNECASNAQEMMNTEWDGSDRVKGKWMQKESDGGKSERIRVECDMR